MKKFLQANQFENIDFLYNNSYCIEDKIIVGTRGWNVAEGEEKMINRESIRLELSIENGLKEYGTDKEMIAFLHYPPTTLNYIEKKGDTDFVKILKKYHIKKCYYGHLHGPSHKDAIVGEKDGITYQLVSADYLNFNLIQI